MRQFRSATPSSPAPRAAAVSKTLDLSYKLRDDPRTVAWLQLCSSVGQFCSMRLLAALLLAALALTGQAVGVSIPNQPPTAPAPQYPPEDLCSIAGQVVNSETGGPVNNASLLLSPRSEEHTSDPVT